MINPLEVVNIEASKYEGESPLRLAGELRACRVCIETDVKLLNLHEFGLANAFEELTKTPVLSSDGLPQHICSLCCALLKKAASFQDKCRATHVFLQDIRAQRPMLTTDLIQNINIPFDFKLLFQTKTLTIDYPAIKTELEADFANLEDVFRNENYDNKNSYVPKDYLVHPKNENEDAGTTDDNFDFENFQDEDEDVVLSKITKLSKTEKKSKGTIQTRSSTKRKAKQHVKLKKIKKSKGRTQDIKRRDIIEDKNPGSDSEVSHLYIDIPEDLETPNKPSKKQKIRKRLYNAKDEDDFEQFCEQYNVDIVQMTKEQQLEDVLARKDLPSYTDAKYQCVECFTGFMSNAAFKKHIAWHDPDRGSHVCEACRMRYPTRDRLLDHLRRHKRHFVCRVCGRRIRSSHAAKTHHMWHEGFKYDCKHCNKKFNVQSTYLNHVRENHTPAICNMCNVVCNGTIALMRHKDIHVESICPHCKSRFISAEGLNRHFMTDGCGLKPCEICGDSLATDGELNEHRLLRHKEQLYNCRKCDTKWKNEKALTIHWTRAHTDGTDTNTIDIDNIDIDKTDNMKNINSQARREMEKKAKRKEWVSRKTFVCEVCGKCYKTACQLNYHQRVHTGEKPYQCTMCPKRFRMKNNLDVHMNTHTGARPYQCALCPERFKSASQMHKHRLLVHTKERPYKCDMCDRTYVVSYDLKSHVHHVHMNVPRPPRKNPRRRRPVLDAEGI